LEPVRVLKRLAHSENLSILVPMAGGVNGEERMLRASGRQIYGRDGFKTKHEYCKVRAHLFQRS
jgi:hypothetical protein